MTPMQMAMVAATIANDGALMEPHVVDKIVGPAGATIRTTRPRKIRQVASPRTANEVTEGMQLAVQAGTSTAAQLPDVAVAGKTGTAEIGPAGGQHRLLHLLRAGRRPAGGDRGLRRAAAQHGRPDGGSDREASPAGLARVAVESIDPYPLGRMATTDTLIDSLFDGRYRILKRIGSGGMADVYLAEDEVLGRRVAIKILNERHARRRPVRQALPPRGAERGLAVAPERGRDLRPRRGARARPTSPWSSSTGAT